MLINLKVKTLDAQTHEFSVENELTVREFKDLVAEKTQIAADQQRIIFCGRVLADDKHLKDFDVDGKVLHVAERPPPSQRGSTSNSTNNDRGGNIVIENGTRGMRNSPLFRALDRMVVGTMAIPVNTQGNGVQPNVPLATSTSFCMNRITVARHMLNCANNIAAYLEDPSRGLSNTTMDILHRGRWTMESTVVEVGITADLPQDQNISDIVQNVVSEALNRNGGSGANVTVVQLPTVYSGSGDADTTAEENAAINAAITEAANAAITEAANAAMTGVSNGPMAGVAHATGTAVIISDDSDDDIDLHGMLQQAAATTANATPASSNAAATNTENATTTTTNTADAAEAESAATETTTNTAADAANTSNSRRSNRTSNGEHQQTNTRVLADVVQQMRTVQTRLDPFIQQYYDFLYNDPSYGENDTEARDNSQRLFDRVSEAIHYMSHAQHAISDLMLDVSQNTPRHLTCRPILVEQSGFVSSNNYISAAAAAAAAAAASAVRQQIPIALAQNASTSNAQNNAATTTSQANNTNGTVTPPPAATSAPAPSAAATPVTPNPTANNSITSGSSMGSIEDPIDDPIVAPAMPAAAAANGGSINIMPQANDGREMDMIRLIEEIVGGSNAMNAEITVQINNSNPFVAFDGSGNGGTPPQQPAQQSQPEQTQQTPQQQQPQPQRVNANANNAQNIARGVRFANVARMRRSGLSHDDAQQTRANTATLPTTSTQTRSTSRPQLQIDAMTAPGRFISANMVSSFDRFLPCNSHHIRVEQQDNANNGNGNNNTNTNANAARPSSIVRTILDILRANERLILELLYIRQRATARLSRAAPASRSASRPLIARALLVARPASAARPTHIAFLTRAAYDYLRGHATTAGMLRVAARPNTNNTNAGTAVATGHQTMRSLRNILANMPAGSNVRVMPNTPQHILAVAAPATTTSTASVVAATAATANRNENLRTQLLRFVTEKVFQGEPQNASTLPQAINRIVAWFNKNLLYLPQYEKPQYDSRDSVLNIVRQTIPRLIELINDKQSTFTHYEQQLKAFFEQLRKRLFSVLFVCIGRPNAEMYWGQLMRLLAVPMRVNFREEVRTFLGVYINTQVPTNTDTEDAAQFLVYRNSNLRATAVIAAVASAAAEPAAFENLTTDSASQTIQADVEMTEVAASIDSGSDSTASMASAESGTDEEWPSPELPNVVNGSEPWHRLLPTAWLPIISRDVQLQTAVPPRQSPYSDAYISGMSAKRRKMCHSNKIPAEVKTLVADGVRKAVQSAGASTSAATSQQQPQSTDEITNAIANDAAVVAAYTDATRSIVRERINNDADYKPEQFPHTTKFVNK